ncbi:MAG: hypothetical protein CME65_02205 [Halobacteriovoraceae bacterium]|nr:hypothetical protein [Halobacteriovoraceae bacterium]|tara:strand:+ start:11053 stop:13050 length:1998 start_codon:yes stop_codon:yes gene_type:complete
MTRKYQRFGKYLILDHLVDGGMAKICRASYLGEQANKIVAIKMVQPQYSQNPSFVQMFEDELKVTFGLVHPNIAQVYDYGLVDQQLYSAMEYVDGANLKQFLDRLKEKKFVFPVEISTHIISQVCQALHYAHTFTDKLTGKHFNIIHRDISPHNIMLTYEGAVKVIDFGIAKADSNSEATQAGTIKGKLSYLAPEYLDGLDLDHRYDQFAVGITLWEMLCSRKLFTAKNDLAVLKQIQACKIPKPSSINPNVPPELDEIVLKALSKDRNNRYENLDKLNRSLVRFLYSNYPEFNATDLSYFAKQLFKEEIVADRKKFVEFGKIDIKPYLDDMKAEENGGSNSAQVKDIPSADGSFITEEQRSGKIELDLGFSHETTNVDGLNLDFNEKTKPSAKNTGTNRIKRPAANREKTSKVKARRSSTQGASNRTTRARVKAGSPSVKKVSQGKKRAVVQEKKSSSPLGIIIAAGLALVVIFKPAMVQNLTGIPVCSMIGCSDTVAGDNPGKTQNPGKEPASVKGVLYFSFADSDTFNIRTFVNGKRKEIIGAKLEVPMNTPIQIKMMKPGHKTWVMEESITLSEDSSTKNVRVPKFEKKYTGYLTTSQNYPPGSKISYEAEGEKHNLDLPLKEHRMPAGTYEFRIYNDLIQLENRVRFTVEPNKRNELPRN